MRFIVIKQIATQASISANGRKGFKKDLSKEPHAACGRVSSAGGQEWPPSGEASNNEWEEEHSRKRETQVPRT